MSREAMQLALEALDSDNPDIQLRAATYLRQALVDVDDMSRTRVDEKAKREHETVCAHGVEKTKCDFCQLKQEPVAWADRIIDDLAELFDKDRIREADSGDALIRLHEAIAVVEEASKLYNKQPTKIFGPSLEEILNSAGFYRKREWISLTDEEIDYQAKKDDHAVYFALGALWAEAKLKEKNNA